MTSNEQLSWEQSVNDGDFDAARRLERSHNPYTILDYTREVDALEARKRLGDDVTEEAAILLLAFSAWQSLRIEHRQGPQTSQDARIEDNIRDSLEVLSLGM